MSFVADQALTGPSQQHFPKNHENEHFDDTKPKNQQNEDIGGWSFLQSLCNNNGGIFRNRGDSPECADKVYIHPLVKRPASKLNEKSLEMCTESLGCESGSESGDNISLLAIEATVPMISLPNRPEVKKPRMTRSNSFPPPLNSASGSNYVHIMRSYRENGRTVVRATRVSSPPPCFIADRSEGRLRLCFSDDSSLSSDEGEEEEEEQQQQHEENETNVESYEEEEEQEEDDKDEEEFTEEETEAKNMDEEEAEEDMEENNENYVGKIGTGKFRRPSSRCKENGHQQKALLNWKNQFWVASN